jgi:hypothetical protein
MKQLSLFCRFMVFLLYMSAIYNFLMNLSRFISVLFFYWKDLVNVTYYNSNIIA